jgi:flagellar protein FlgJ
MEIALGQQVDTHRYASSNGLQKEQAEREAIKKAAADFEAVFLGIMMKSMRDSVQKSGLVDGGNSEDIYQSMLDTEYTKQMANQNFTGLSRAIEDQLLRNRVSETLENVRAANVAGLEKFKGIQAYGLPR